MSWKGTKNISLIVLAVVILLIPLYLLVQCNDSKSVAVTSKASFVGSDKCIECHRQEYNDWQNSHHAKSMNHANDSTVLGDFNNQTLDYNNITHKMYKRNNKYFVYTDGANGKLQEFEIKYVFGFYPMQQYMVEFPGGRLQMLPLTWDTQHSKWYHIAAVNYPDEIIEHTNWLHWTNQAQTWNSMCADCHSTNLVKGYDIETDSYKTTYSEINVACEACHGPASNHIKWTENKQVKQCEDNYGLTVRVSNIDNEAYVNLCMRCHSRRVEICDFNHDAEIYNHSIAELPTGQNYFIDGQILAEDYVFASFTQSKMFMRGVKCSDCHKPHSNKLMFDDNRLCTQCHKADDYDSYRHHFHKSKGEKGNAVIAKDGVKFEVGEGARCINCHAPARFYMGPDYRNDHSFRIPRPDLSDKLNTPNACNHCHADKSTQWAVNYVNKWHGVSRHLQYGEVFNDAKNIDNKSFTKLKKMYNDKLYPPIVRATAISLIGQYYQKEGKDILLSATQNENNHIKYNALKSLIVDDEKSFKGVLQLLYDSTKAIRIECANKLIAINKNQIPNKYLRLLEKSENEYFAYLKYNSDFPTGKFNLANYYYNTGQFAKAEKFYLKTLEQDNELHTAKINLAYLYNNLGKYEKADSMFNDYLKNVPKDGNTTFAYSLFLSERRNYKKSLHYMLKASKLSPDNDRILFNIAMMYDFEKKYSKAKKYLQKAIDIDKNNQEYRSAMINLMKKKKEETLQATSLR